MVRRDIALSRYPSLSVPSVVFVRLHRKSFAMTLSGKICWTWSVKWSETFAGRLCLATKNKKQNVCCRDRVWHVDGLSLEECRHRCIRLSCSSINDLCNIIQWSQLALPCPVLVSLSTSARDRTPNSPNSNCTSLNSDRRCPYLFFPLPSGSIPQCPRGVARLNDVSPECCSLREES